MLPFLHCHPERCEGSGTMGREMLRCMAEIKNYRHGELSNAIYGLELFRRALKERDPFAWEIIQLQFNDMMLQWMRSHPMRIVACRYDSEENYVAQAFPDVQEIYRLRRIIFERLQRNADYICWRLDYQLQ